MKRVLLVAVFLFLSVTGGMQFYLNPVIQITYLLAGLIVIMAAFYFFSRGDRPPLLPSALIMICALIMSALANIDIYTVAVGRIIQAFIATGALVVAYRLNGVKEALYLAGWVWPWLYLLVSVGGLYNHQNIIAVWPVIFIMVGLTGKNLFYLLPNLAALAWLGSRGALIGLAAGVIVFSYPYLKPYLKIKWAALCAAPLAAGVYLLYIWRQTTALVRLHYWQNAFNTFERCPFFGVGPGGLWARRIIPEGDWFVTHAHNGLLTLLAEGGLVGVIGLVLALYILPRVNLARWQWSILAALMAHSLVDEPLWWPGPLVAAAIIFGAKPHEPVYG